MNVLVKAGRIFKTKPNYKNSVNYTPLLMRAFGDIYKVRKSIFSMIRFILI